MNLVLEHYAITQAVVGREEWLEANSLGLFTSRISQNSQ